MPQGGNKPLTGTIQLSTIFSICTCGIFQLHLTIQTVFMYVYGVKGTPLIHHVISIIFMLYCACSYSLLNNVIRALLDVCALPELSVEYY